jgi:hypothetical protein
LNQKLHEAQLEDRKPEKIQKGHLEEGKAAKSSNGMKSNKPKKYQRKI